MINTELELLLNKHIQGEISFAAYREKRKQLIQEFISNYSEDSENITDFDTTQNIKPISEPKSSLEIPVLTKKATSHNLNYTKLIVLGALVVLAGLAFIFGKTPETNSDNTLLEKNDVSQPQIKNIQTEPFIDEFLLSNDWDTESLSNFLVTWQELDSEKRILARKSTGFKKVAEKLNEELSTLKHQDPKDAQRKEKLLKWFATQLAIDINKD